MCSINKDETAKQGWEPPSLPPSLRRLPPTFVLADLLDPGQRVDLHEGVGNTDDVHHVHHALTDTQAGHENQGKYGATIRT